MQPLDIGVSAISAGTTQAFGGQVVFSNSNNITFGVNGHTVTATVAAAGVTAVSGIGVSTGGNTSGTTGTVVGTVVLAGINHITLSQATAAGPIATVTISGRDAVFGAGVSTGGNTSGNTGTTHGTVVLEGGNNITLSQVTAAGSSATVVISARDGVFGAGISTGGNTSGTSGTNTGTFVLAGINNITLSQATGPGGNTVTISGPNALAISAGTQSASSGTVVFSNSNNVTFGMSNSSVVTASVGNVATTVSAFSHNAEWNSNWVVQQGILSLQRVTVPVNVTLDSAFFVMDLRAPVAATGGMTLSMGVYTFTGSTASLSTSFSGSTTWTSGTNSTASSVYGGVSGTRYRPLGAPFLLPPGDYLVGVHVLTTNAGTWNIFGRQGMSLVSHLALPVNATNNFIDGVSLSSFSTALPTGVIVTDTNYNRTGQSALRQPGFIVLTAV